MTTSPSPFNDTDDFAILDMQDPTTRAVVTDLVGGGASILRNAGRAAEALQDGSVDGVRLVSLDTDHVTLSTTNGSATDTYVLDNLSGPLANADGPVDLGNSIPEFGIFQAGGGSQSAATADNARLLGLVPGIDIDIDLGGGAPGVGVGIGVGPISVDLDIDLGISLDIQIASVEVLVQVLFGGGGGGGAGGDRALNLIAMDNDSLSLGIRNNDGTIDTLVIDGIEDQIDAIAGGLDLFDDRSQLGVFDYENLRPGTQDQVDALVLDLILGDGASDFRLVSVDEDSVAISSTVGGAVDGLVFYNASELLETL